jgi:hypothetical protein
VIALQAKKEIYIFLSTLSNFFSVLSKVWTGSIIIKYPYRVNKRKKKREGRKEKGKEMKQIVRGNNEEGNIGKKREDGRARKNENRRYHAGIDGEYIYTPSSGQFQPALYGGVW